MLGRVNSIETMACDDGWDVRFAVFLQGCGAKCIYCANVLTWDFNGGELMDSNDIIEQMVTDFKITGTIDRDQFKALLVLIDEIYFPVVDEIEEEPIL